MSLIDYFFKKKEDLTKLQDLGAIEAARNMIEREKVPLFKLVEGDGFLFEGKWLAPEEVSMEGLVAVGFYDRNIIANGLFSGKPSKISRNLHLFQSPLQFEIYQSGIYKPLNNFVQILDAYHSTPIPMIQPNDRLSRIIAANDLVVSKKWNRTIRSFNLIEILRGEDTGNGIKEIVSDPTYHTQLNQDPEGYYWNIYDETGVVPIYRGDSDFEILQGLVS
ncbi:MAG: hypothetical protein ABIE22_02380 [archaeon]